MIRISLVVWGVLGTAAAHAQANVSICSEPGDGPPWLYWQKPADDATPQKLAGFTNDMTQAAYARMGKAVAFRGNVPWARCLKMVAAREIDFASGAYFSDERARTYDYSHPYKTLTPQVFTLAGSSVRIASTADLGRYRGCGMNGSSYSHYGLHAGDLDQGSRSYTSLIHKLKAGRCDYFVEELEVIAQLNGGRDHYLEDPKLRHSDIDGATRPTLHLIAAKGSPAALLLPQFDDAFQKMQKAGEVQKLWKKHAGDLAY